MQKAILTVSLMMGALAAQADAPKYGAIRFDCDVTIDGKAVAADTAVYATTWPTQMCVRPVVPEGKTFFRFESDAVDGVDSCPTSFYLQMDGSFYVVPPAFGDTVRDFRHVYATRTIWVDADAEDGDTAGDGTKDNPYHTLQYAVDQVPDIEPTIVYAKPGDYDEGGKTAGTASNRVVIAQDRTVLLKAVGGPSVTAIVGEADTTTYPELQVYYPGLGPLAKRCVYVCGKSANTGGCCVQGFTLRDGHAYQAYGSDSKPYNPWGYACTQGSAFYSEAGYENQVVDCVVRECTAGKGLVQGTLLRTLVTKCYSANCLYEGGWAVSCAFVDDYGDGRMGNYQAYPNYAHQNMLGGRLMLDTTLPYASMSGGTYWNGAYGSQFIPNAASRLWGSIFTNAGQGDAGGGVTYVKTKEQYFADSANNDARIIKASIAETGVKSPTVGTTDWYVWATNFAAVATSDINGKRILFRADGTPLPGAYQDPVQAFVLSNVSCGFDVTSPSGGMCGSAGETITISPNTNGTRYAAGVIIGGETYYFGDQPNGSVSYTVPETFESGSVPVTVLVSRIWWLDAEHGSDNAKGISSNTAWKTLAYASRRHGDGTTGGTGAIFRLLPGVYDEGVTDLYGNWEDGKITGPRCRIRFYFGGTIESTDGPEKTIIKGADAPGEDCDEYGCGTNAVGCIGCYSSCADRPVVIRGVTLTGGRTYSTSDGKYRPFEDAFYVGSALRAFQHDYRYITLEDCIITNNIGNAYTVRGSTVRRCVFDDNHVDYSCSVMDGGTLENCLIKSGSAEVKECRNTTFGKDTSFGLADGAAAVNSIFGGAFSWDTYYYGRVFTNCIVSTSANYAKCTLVDCIVTNYAAIGIDDKGIPTNKTSLVVDAANPAFIPAGIGEKDALGNQRIYNGAMDLGGVEYDWRGEYAKDVSRKGLFDVTAATTNVVESATQTVVISNGQSLAGVWTAKAPPKYAFVRVRIVGSGTFKVLVGGKVVATRTGPVVSPVFVAFPGAVDAASSPRQKVEFSYSEERGEDTASTKSGYAEILRTGFMRGLMLLVR